MKRTVLAGIIVASCNSAFAQGVQPPPPAPEVRALYAKLGAEIEGGVKCNAQFIAAQDAVGKLKQELADAKAEIQKLKGGGK